MVNMKNYRHGDLLLVGIKKLPPGLTKNKGNVIMKGSNNNPHKVENGELYFSDVDEFVFGYLVAGKDCVLLHKEHGEVVKGNTMRVAQISEGVYELRRQVEDTNDGMVPVLD